MPRHSPCALFSLTWRRRKVRLPPFPLSAKTLTAPLLLLFHQKSIGFLMRGRGLRSSLWLDQRNLGSLELCRQFFREIVIVTHLYDVPQLKYTLLCLFRHRTSLLPYFTLLLHCSVFKVHCPITFAIRFEDPTFQSGLQIQQQTLFGGPEWARTTDLAIISRTL